MTQFSFLDVGFTYRSVQAEMDAAYRQVMDSGYFIGGKALDQFEAEFAALCGVRHCIGLGNGLEALVLPLRARGIGPGDEVIVPANTFIATWLAVAQTGATVVPVDADPATMNIDLDAVERAITAKTKAIVPVHLYGAPVPSARLRALAEARGLFLMEDAAQAHGGADQGRPVGALGDAAAFSFYPGKNLGAFGDGGALVTNDDDLADRVRMLGNYGSRVKYYHDLQGGNSRLDPMQAAFLSVKLKHLADWTQRRREIAAVYDAALSGLNELRLPQIAAGTEPVWHLYVVRHPRREALKAALEGLGVPTALHYPVPNHQSGAFRAEFGSMSFPVTEEICATCLSLPIGPHLSVADAQEIAARVGQAVKQV
jgi:dTDP-3-amino-3,4,6-trideoxy-alpha-D-glucose transaminase